MPPTLKSPTASAKPKATAKAAKADAPKAAPKLAAPKGAAKKPGKAVATVKTKAKSTAAVPAFKTGQHVEFLGYSSQNDQPMFKKGDILAIVGKKKDDDKGTLYQVVSADDFDAYNTDPDTVQGDEVFPTEIKAVPKVERDEFAIEVPKNDKLDNAIKAAKGDVLAAAVNFADKASENHFLLGGALGLLYKGKEFQKHGKKGAYEDVQDAEGGVKRGSGWDKFCEDNFGISGRKAESMITIFRTFGSLKGVDLEELYRNKKIGYVKLEYAASVINDKNAKEILAAAEKESVPDFKAIIKTDYVGADSGTRSTAPKVKRTTYKFSLFEDQAAGVEYILEQAKKQNGDDDLNTTFEKIVTQWAMQNLTEAQAGKARAAVRSKQKALKADGVDVEPLKKRDAELEQFLGGEDTKAAA